MSKELVVNPTKFGISKEEVGEITKGLDVIQSEREVLKDAYLDVIELEVTEENLSVFKELRLKFVKNRTQGLDKWKTTRKAYFLAGGNFIQAIYNDEVRENQEIEAKLMAAEKHFENLEKERLEKLQTEREWLLKDYVEDAHERDLSFMDDDVWNSYLNTKKQQFEDKKAAEEKAEAERIESARIEAERIKAQEIENAKLKAEAEAREKEIAKQKAIQDKKEAEAKAELEKVQKELKAKEDAELKAKIEAEKEIANRKKEADRLAKAPLKSQLKTWVLSLTCGEPPILDDTVKDILVKFESFREWSLKEIDKL